MVPVYASKFLSKLNEVDRETVMRSGIVPVNDVYMPYWNSAHRHQVYYGGRGSGKSKFIAQKLVSKCANDKYFRWQYSRKHQVDIKESQYELLKATISEHGLWNQFSFNQSTLRITHKSGNCLIAKGMDDPEKSKGLYELNGFWGEEITEFEQDDLIAVNQNLRTLKAPLESIVGFNPVHEDHWVRHYYFTQGNAHIIKPEFEGVAVRTTLYHNHFINQEQYAKDLIAGSCGNPNIIRVVLEGDWGLTENGNPWLYAFRDNHIKNTHLRPLPFLSLEPIYLTFDINAEPLSCTAWQRSRQMGGEGAYLHAIKEFGGHIKVDDICAQIRTTFPNSIFYVTGDRSGQNQDVGRNQTIYQMIQAHLNLSDRQMNLNTHNLEHADSRLLCNAIFEHYPIYIDPVGCPTLVADIRKATVDMDSVKGNQLQKDRGEFKMDYFDGMRYLFQTYYLQYIRDQYLYLLK